MIGAKSVGYKTIHLSESSEGMTNSTEDDAKGPIRLLYVEDEPGVSMITQALLETEGFAVDHAANGNDALAKFASGASKYDVVLTDDAMPEVTGVQLTEQLREQGFTGSVVVYSGVVDTNKARAYRALGVSAIVHKLDPLDQLVSALRSAARGKG